MTESLLKRYYFERSFGLAEERTEEVKNENGQFNELCEKKNYHNDCTPEEEASRIKFIEIVDRINVRHPFVILLEFVDDIFAGEYSKDLITKYHILNYVDLNYILERILKLEGTRFKRSTNNARKKNISNKNWAAIYDFVSKNSNYFRSEQLYLLNYNILRAAIIIYLFNSSEKKSTADLNLNLRSIVDEAMDKINILRDPDIRYSFLKFIDKNTVPIIGNIVNELRKKDFLE